MLSDSDSESDIQQNYYVNHAQCHQSRQTKRSIDIDPEVKMVHCLLLSWNNNFAD